MGGEGERDSVTLHAAEIRTRNTNTGSRNRIIRIRNENNKYTYNGRIHVQNYKLPKVPIHCHAIMLYKVFLTHTHTSKQLDVLILLLPLSSVSHSLAMQRAAIFFLVLSTPREQSSLFDRPANTANAHFRDSLCFLMGFSRVACNAAAKEMHIYVLIYVRKITYVLL